MCLRAFHNLHLDLTVKSATENFLSLFATSARGNFSLQDALLSKNFGSTGSLHYFRAIHKVRAHASYMDVVLHASNRL
ncbi:hypothetical protein SAMN04488029_3188 [Reichenbachiella faecimaris]|uniref:Uncharacterized protein n=1 Tax=Reichenbachiella faecimaris TaxID=692418 RepID=A0A1W2GKY2_REIFA|nr:hypothetical protein SAMN04488029_3188 [Reichenbachiella faecimaris]